MIYVDELHECRRTRTWHYTQACHLFADSLPELHRAARRLGLRREWFQPRTRLPHYDLSPHKRRAALGLGAMPVGRHFVANRLKAQRGRQAGFAAGSTGS